MEEVSRALEADAWASSLGMTLVDAAPEGVTVRMPLSASHLNFHGGAHGGALFSLVETTMALCARAGGAVPHLIDAHLALTAGGTEGDVFEARAVPINVGRSLGVYRVSVTRSDGRTVGEFTGTVSFQ